MVGFAYRGAIYIYWGYYIYRGIPSHVGLRPTVSIRAWPIRGARWAPVCTAEHDVHRLGAKCRTLTCEGIQGALNSYILEYRL